MYSVPLPGGVEPLGTGEDGVAGTLNWVQADTHPSKIMTRNISARSPAVCCARTLRRRKVASDINAIASSRPSGRTGRTAGLPAGGCLTFRYVIARVTERDTVTAVTPEVDEG